MYQCKIYTQTIKTHRMCQHNMGTGLKPLANSTVLELIDMSTLGRFEDPVTDGSFSERMGISTNSVSMLSRDAILPILNSIIDSNEISLKCIAFPLHWSAVGPYASSSWQPELYDFMERYNRLCRGRELTCSQCTKSMRGNASWLLHSLRHQNTCFICTKHYCDKCYFLRASYRERFYCAECIPDVKCVGESCANVICRAGAAACDVCCLAICQNCVSQGGCPYRCASGG